MLSTHFVLYNGGVVMRAREQNQDGAGSIWDRWGVLLAVIGLFISVVSLAQQFGWLDDVLGARLADVPQVVNVTGVQIEEQAIGYTNQPGRVRKFELVVTRAPQRGKWRGLLCSGDRIEFINGYEADLSMARRMLYVDRGRTLRILTNVREPAIMTIEPDSFARDCPA